jgi:acetolactate synthase-1/2/3 large subunit
MTGADLIIKTLKRYGIDWIATLCGHGLDPLFNAARHGGIRLIDTRNEQTASYIAEACGRLTRRPGVCAVSSGVAHVNALAGVANAWFDRSPMLLISGAASTATAGKGHFQEMDQPAIAQPLCKMAVSVLRADDIAPSLDEALQEAMTPPCGPVHLTFPMDVQNCEVPQASLTHVESLIDAFGVDEPDSVAAALAGAMRPVLIAGSGVFYSNTGTEMLTFCDRYRIPVMTPIWDRGSVKESSFTFMGVVGAATGGPAVLAEADCILMAGAECDYRVGYLEPPAVRPDARIRAVGTRWNELGAACERRNVRAYDEWLSECAERRDRFRAAVQTCGEEQARVGLHAIHIIRAIESVLQSDPVLLIDGGTIGQWAHQLLCSDRYPADWLTCGRSGVVGWGVGGGIAARLAFPDRPVILLTGDGAFTFNVADIESAVRQRMPFVILVADDQAWGITRTGHIRQFGEPIASSLGCIAFDSLAAALGARGVRANTPEEIGRHLRDALEQEAVTLIHVPIVGGHPA